MFFTSIKRILFPPPHWCLTGKPQKTFLILFQTTVQGIKAIKVFLTFFSVLLDTWWVSARLNLHELIPWHACMRTHQQKESLTWAEFKESWRPTDTKNVLSFWANHDGELAQLHTLTDLNTRWCSRPPGPRLWCLGEVVSCWGTPAK